MAYEEQQNRIAIFVNKKKQEGTKQPDYKGKFDVDGVEYEVSMWRRTTKNGDPYLMGNLKPANAWRTSPERQDYKPTVKPPAPAKEEESDIPF